MLTIRSCPKGFTADLDKTCSPEQTIARALEAFTKSGTDILAKVDRIDTGRLDIPVYMSVCGTSALQIMPTRKQMGKGASPEQAQASALMELAERFSFFHFWNEPKNFRKTSWAQVPQEKRIPIELLQKATGDTELSVTQAEDILGLRLWDFAPVTDLNQEREYLVPVEIFRKLNEYNGSSAGNTLEEAILQGACELIERHVCAFIDKTRIQVPTIDPESFTDPVLCDLHQKFLKQGLIVLLKDFSQKFPVPTVAAVVMDPSTFPEDSEIVFTAGTATSPQKAAIRALTEIAQLGGDFETGSVYEASGLPKFSSPEEFAWLTTGPVIGIEKLPDISQGDIAAELCTLCAGLSKLGFTLLSMDITIPELNIPACYTAIPGLLFRERTPRSSLGLFTGRMLAEEEPEDLAEQGLKALGSILPEAYFLPFFRGLLSLRQGNTHQAKQFFAAAEPVQPDAEERALALFYHAYTLSLEDRWQETPSLLTKAITLSPEVKEYHNLLGVAFFKSKSYAQAADCFSQALALDNGSAMDMANLGLCHKFLGNTQEAQRFLSTALSLDPSLEFAKTHLSELQ